MTEGLNEEQLRDRNNRIEAARQLQQIADHELDRVTKLNRASPALSAYVCGSVTGMSRCPWR